MKNGFEYLSYTQSSCTDEEFCKKSLRFTDGLVEKFEQMPPFAPSIATSLGQMVDRSPLLEEHRAHCKAVLSEKVDFDMVGEEPIGVSDTKTGDKDQCHDFEMYLTHREWRTMADEN